MDNPSSGELAVMEILDGICAYSRKEYIEGIGYVDFIIGSTIIEVEGEIHRKPEVFGERNESERYQALRDLGYRVLIVDDRDINEQQILEVLQ